MVFICVEGTRCIEGSRCAKGACCVENTRNIMSLSSSKLVDNRVIVTGEGITERKVKQSQKGEGWN